MRKAFWRCGVCGVLLISLSVPFDRAEAEEPEPESESTETADEGPTEESTETADEGPAQESDESAGPPVDDVQALPAKTAESVPEASGLTEQAPEIKDTPTQQDTKDKKRVSVSFTEDLEIRYWTSERRLPDPDDVAVFNYLEQVNRLVANASLDSWTFGLQLDQVSLLANRYYLNDQLEIERDLTAPNVYNPLPGDLYLNPEKVWFKYENSRNAVQIGDFYTAFGRGMALNLSRNVDIDIDTSIQGVSAVFRPGAWDVTAVVGQLNRQQVFQDNPNIGITIDNRHFVGGLRAERFGLGPANIGAHAVVYNFADDGGWNGGFDNLSSPLDAIVGGASAELMGVGGVDWYVEGNVINYPTEALDVVSDDEDIGYGVYGSASFYGSSTTFLVEAKRYSDLERLGGALAGELYEVAIAPTLEYERSITEDSSAAMNSNDIYGGRFRVDWSAVPGELIPYASVSVFRDDELGGLHFNRTEETIVHPMLGLEWVAHDKATFLNLGVRNDIRDGGDNKVDRHIHGDVNLKLPLFAGLHLDYALYAEHFHWGVNQFQQHDYVEVESSFGIQKGSALTVTWFTDVTTDPLVDSTGNLAESVYGAVEVQVKPTSALTLKAFYGAYKAGIRCSGGQCRLMPGFDGARASVVGTF